MPNDEDLSPLDLLDKKIKSAQGKSDEEEGSQEEGIGKSLSFAMRVSIELTAGIAIGAIAGFYLDRWLGTMPLFFILCFFLGTAAGGINVYRMVSKSDSKN